MRATELLRDEAKLKEVLREAADNCNAKVNVVYWLRKSIFVEAGRGEIVFHSPNGAKLVLFNLTKEGRKPCVALTWAG